MTDAQLGFWIMAGSAIVLGIIMGFNEYLDDDLTDTQEIIMYALAAFIYHVGELLFYPAAMAARRWGSVEIVTISYAAAAIIIGVLAFLAMTFVVFNFLRFLRWLAYKFLSISPPPAD